MLYVLCFLTSWNPFIQQEWTWSVHPEAGFKILTPVELVHNMREVPTEKELILYHQYHGGSLSDTNLAMAFVVDHYILSAGTEGQDPDDQKEFFENSIDQMLQSLDGTLLYMDIIPLMGQDLCTWKATYQKGTGIIRGHMILARGKYYGLQVFGINHQQPDATMNKFLESFRLIGNINTPAHK
jgi:hypothetical protein